jgi:MerR family mercuric resistance operon transcriptional regulator
MKILAWHPFPAIRKRQPLTLYRDEIAGLLRLRVGRRARCADVRRKAEAKLRQVDGKIATLKSMRRVLMGLVRTCQRQRITATCPILDSLEGDKP